jgi:hypothetical protein
MNCNNCGKPNDNESNFCKYCGTNLKETTDAAINPHQTIFATQGQPKSNTELGYLIIALIIFINICLWLFWTFLSNSISSGGNNVLYKMIRMISLCLTIAQFIVMFIFAKRQSFRIVIGIIAGFVIIYDLYYLIRMLSDISRY